MSRQSKLAVMASRQARMAASSKFGAFASRLAWAPLACLLWLFTPVRSVRVHTPDLSEDYTTYRGFPLLVESDAPHMGMYRDHYIAPAIFNLLFFAIVAFLLVYVWRRRPSLKYRELDWIIGIPVYLLGLFAFYVLLMWFFVLDGLSYWWIDKSGWHGVEGLVLPFP